LGRNGERGSKSGGAIHCICSSGTSKLTPGRNQPIEWASKSDSAEGVSAKKGPVKKEEREVLSEVLENMQGAPYTKRKKLCKGDARGVKLKLQKVGGENTPVVVSRRHGPSPGHNESPKKTIRHAARERTSWKSGGNATLEGMLT